MIRAMLADDEVLTIKMLETLIEREDLGIEIVATASDGVEALEKYKALLPAIVITDIRMPKLSGLEFMGKVRAMNSEAEFIFISAHADFSYAAEAMRLGGASYILKPIDEVELRAAIRKIADKINNKYLALQQTERNDRFKAKILLRDHMKTGLRTSAAAKAFEALAGNAPPFVLLCVAPNAQTINEYTELTGVADHHLNDLLARMQTIIRRRCDCLSFEYEEHSWLILLFCGDPACITEVAEALLKYLKEECKINARAVFSRPAGSFGELSASYKQVRQYLKYSVFVDAAGVIGFDRFSSAAFDKAQLEAYTRDMKSAVKQRQEEQLADALGSALKLTESISPEHLQDIYDFCFEMIRMIRDVCMARPGNGRIADVPDVSYDELQSIPQLESLREFMLMAASQLFSGESSRSRKYSDLVGKGISLLEERYNSNISLDEICESLSVSKNYFSYLFKHDTGTSLWVYLTSLRIRKAMEFLETTDLKSYEVAYRVGYDNPSYFAKLFKKYAGQTPNEYRLEKRGGAGGV